VGLCPPGLQVGPGTDMVTAGNPGGPFAPSSFEYQLSATTGSVNYSISGVPNWLTASATSGNVSSSGTTVTFTVNANANTLAPGTYGPITISFTNSDTGLGTQNRVATLTVNPPALQVTPATNIVACNRERDARAAMARVLRNPDRELSIALRFRLAALFDADHHYETREFVIKNRKRGVRPDHLVDMSIADDIAREVMAGEQVEAAVQLEAERYGVTHATAGCRVLV
jgi:hypothetical protein